MKYYIVYNIESGEIINNIMSSKEYVVDNESLTAIAVGEDDYRKSCNQLHYVSNGTLVQIASQPSLNHVYDYHKHQWVDGRSLDDVKVDQWNLVKRDRLLKERSGFIHNGHVFNSDSDSQLRISVMSIQTSDIKWVNLNNVEVMVKPSELYSSMCDHLTAIHEEAQKIKQAIYNATSFEEVCSCVLPESDLVVK